ncbi:carboxylesterase family protein [Brevundimonas sp.]|uniref:carboxylesterase/lipase family protein n=1 Tax=Brevundimonas sp. TaxID=1871086 RepID=UPI0028A93685|nr:carboxylesterase family protein [Brevundimonas sp.]
MDQITHAATQPVVHTVSGSLRGLRDGAANVFRGIPYAAAPVGELRWRAPRPFPAWTSVREATEFGPAAPQAGPADVADIVSIGGAPEPTSEDCLTLNIWTPIDTTRPAPVMVWLHGGSNRMGAGSLPFYDGGAFARDGVVLVSVNYRLGQFGFFAHPALTAEAPVDEPLGNQGLLDQIAALEWVRAHIAAFGGDAANITLFGESAGGLDILALMTTSQASGLFHKVIVQSGGGWLPATPLKTAYQRGLATAAAIGLTNADAGALRAVPSASLTAVESAFGPVIDGRLLDQDPISAFANGDFTDVPMMIGVNSGEDSLLNYGGGLKRFGQLIKPNAKLAKLYPEAAGDEEQLIRLGFRDFGFAAPARWVASRPRRAKAWLYAFDYVEETRRDAMLRASHAAEIFHVFEALDHRPDDPPPATVADRAISTAIHARWVDFAKTGSPGADWPVYRPADDAWMVFNETPGGEVRRGWWKAPLDHHGRKGGLLILLLRIRDRLRTLFSAKVA